MVNWSSWTIFPPQIQVHFQINISIVTQTLVTTQEMAVLTLSCIVLSGCGGRGDKTQTIQKKNGPIPNVLSSMFFSVLRNKKKKENVSYCSFVLILSSAGLMKWCWDRLLEASHMLSLWTLPGLLTANFHNSSCHVFNIAPHKPSGQTEVHEASCTGPSEIYIWPVSNYAHLKI